MKYWNSYTCEVLEQTLYSCLFYPQFTHVASQDNVSVSESLSSLKLLSFFDFLNNFFLKFNEAHYDLIILSENVCLNMSFISAIDRFID